MDITSSDNSSNISENLSREMQLSREDQSKLEVPEISNNPSQVVSKSSEAYELSGSLSEKDCTPSQCQQPGERAESVDNVDDAGLDGTREPDWEVVEPTELPHTPQPGEHHNDKYWDERSLDSELQNKDLQEEIIREEYLEFDQSTEIAKDPSRSYQNDVLDPYYQSGSDSSNPPSAGNSLDSFV